jgi:hypothetical protein
VRAAHALARCGAFRIGKTATAIRVRADRDAWHGAFPREIELLLLVLADWRSRYDILLV